MFAWNNRYFISVLFQFQFNVLRAALLTSNRRGTGILCVLSEPYIPQPTSDVGYSMCMLNHCLEWDKWVLTNFDHDRQWFNTLIPPSHYSTAVTVDCISRFSGPVRLAQRYTMPDIHCRNKRYEWDGGIASQSGSHRVHTNRMLQSWRLIDIFLFLCRR